MINPGLLAALGTAIFWGSYMVPFKRLGSPNIILFQTLTAVGIGVSGLIISIILSFPITLNSFGLLSGVLWVLGNFFGLRAVANLGLSKAVPVMSSLVVILTFLWGAIIFGEVPSGIIIGFIGVLLIILGVILVSLTGKSESKDLKKGFTSAFTAGLIWGSQLVPMKAGNVSPEDFFFPLCLGIFLSGITLFILFKGKFQNGVIGLSLLSGLIWNIGNLLALFSVSLIGLSKAGPTMQVATLVAVSWGLIYFKEITSQKIKIQILTGAIILLAGIFILRLA